LNTGWLANTWPFAFKNFDELGGSQWVLLCLVAVGPIVKNGGFLSHGGTPKSSIYKWIFHCNPAIGSPIYASQARWPTSQMKERQVKARCPETGDAFVDEIWRY